MLFGIPKSCAEPDFSGFMLEALSYASTETTLTAYYDIACKTKYSYVEENAEMLDIIFDGIIFDHGMIFRNSIGLYNILGSTIPAKGENIFASEFASMESESQKALEDLIAAVDASGS